MKKLISFVLVLVLLATAVPAFAVIAEEETTPGFVIDGVLDEWYRDDEWALENGFYNYYTSDDTTLDVVSKVPGADNGVTDVWLEEDVQVKIYAAYDNHYAYFYVDVLDPHIATYYENEKGEMDANSQYIENIDFYVDTDYGSCEGDFFDNCASYSDADTCFRMIAHNMNITGTRPDPKYIFENEKNLPDGKTGEARTNASGYFSHPENTAPFQKFDDAGNLIGFGCETRVPLAYWYGETDYLEVYYNIAVAQSTSDDQWVPCAVTTGKRWWVAYDTGRMFYLEFDKDNPFLGAIENDPNGGEDTPVPPVTGTEVLDLGDPTGDDKIDAKDALFVLKVSVNKLDPTDAQKTACDVNKDNNINAKDALEILKFAVNKPSCLA